MSQKQKGEYCKIKCGVGNAVFTDRKWGGVVAKDWPKAGRAAM